MPITGLTKLHTCDTGASGVAPSAPLSGSIAIAASLLAGQYGANNTTGVGKTGYGRINDGNLDNGSSRVGGQYPVTSADLSVARRVFFGHVNLSGIYAEDFGQSAGVFVSLNSDSTGAYEASWSIGGGNAIIGNTYAFVVNANRQTDSADYDASFDPSNVTNVGINVVNDVGYGNIYCDEFGFADPIEVTGGTQVSPYGIQDIKDYLEAQNANLIESATPSSHHMFCSLKIGDGVTETHFKMERETLEWTRRADFVGVYPRAHLEDNDLGHQLVADSVGSYEYSLVTFKSEIKSHWESIGATDGNVSYNSCNVENKGSVKLFDGHVFSSGTFDDCATIEANNPTINSTAIRNAPGSALRLTDGGGGNLSVVEFVNNECAIENDDSGDASIDITGTILDDSNTYFIRYTGTQTLTVTANAALDAGKLDTPNGGTIAFALPPATLTIDGLVNGCEIRIYDDENPDPHNFDTELAGTETLSGTEFQFGHSKSGDTVVVQMMAAGYKEIIQRVFLTSVDQTVTFIPKIDENL